MSSNVRHNQGKDSLYVGSGSVTLATLAAAAEADYTISDSNAEVTDVISASMQNASPGMADASGSPAIVGAWVSAAGTISIRVSNVHASGALTGGAVAIYYTIQKSS